MEKLHQRNSTQLTKFQLFILYQSCYVRIGITTTSACLNFFRGDNSDTGFQSVPMLTYGEILSYGVKIKAVYFTEIGFKAYCQENLSSCFQVSILSYIRILHLHTFLNPLSNCLHRKKKINFPFIHSCLPYHNHIPYAIVSCRFT